MKALKFAGWGWLVIATILAATITATAQTNKRPNLKSGLYLGVQLPQASFGGDFDGTQMIYTSNEAIAIPKINGAFGVGFVLGYRGRQFAYELSRTSQNLDGTWAGASTKVKVVTYTLNGKLMSRPFRVSTLPSQFYLLYGVSIPSLTVQDGAIAANPYGYDDYVSGDGKFTGIAFNLGLGLDLGLTERIVASGSVGYRILRYPGAKGVNGEMLSVAEGIGGNGMTTSVGIAFTL